VGGTGVALWQARVADQQRQRAEQRLTDVRELAGSFLFEFHDAIDELPGSTPARELVVKRAQEYLGRLSPQTGGDPSLQLDLAVAYGKLGDVQGNPTNANLGRAQAALGSYRTGLDFVRDVLAHDSIRADVRSVQANLYEKLGDVQAATGALADAETSKRRSVALYRERARTDTAGRTEQSEYAVALIKLGDLLGNPNFQNRGQHDEALAQYREAEPILARLYDADSSATNTMRLYGLIYERIGTIHDVQDRTEAALTAYRRSLSIREQYAAANPSNTDAIRDWAVAHEKMGHMLVQKGDLEAARSRYQESLGIFRRLYEADSENVQAQRSLAISHMHLGDLAHYPSRPSFDEPGVARQHYETARSLFAAVLRVDSARTDTRSHFERVNERLAGLP
jgi:non-specific serine/threonine protein kinase/serine/threonine-protein kinase